MDATNYIESLVAAGRYHFSSDDAMIQLAARPAAVRAQLRRLVEQGKIASPLRSFYVIIPGEYRRLGCLPAHQFIDDLMAWLGQPYYVGLLSAAEHHGAGHQRPQVLQVMVQRNRADIECSSVRIGFIARHDMEVMPVVTANTSRGTIRYSTAEVTALELVGYPNHVGGLSNAATIVSELAHDLDANRLLEVGKKSPMGWSQRLGYLLELVGEPQKATGLAEYVRESAHTFSPIRRAASYAGARRDARWKLILNAAIEPDL